LHYTPQKNSLPSSDSPYLVHTEHSGIVEPEQFVDIMAGAHSTLTKPDIAAGQELMNTELVKLLADGKFVKLGFGALYVCAAGKLDSLDQAFSPGSADGSHTLSIHFRVDRDFEAAVCSKVVVERGPRYDRNAPFINAVIGVKSESAAGAAPGEFVRVEGQRLKFDRSVAAEGLFFIDGAETKAVQYASITPSLVIAQVPPDLKPGNYVVVLRSSQGRKDLHEGRLEKTFTIA